MKKELQEFISELNDLKETSTEMVGEFAEYDENQKLLVQWGKCSAFSFCIEKLTQILNNHI